METTLDWRRIEVIDDDVAAVLRRKTPAERILLASGLNKTMRLMLAGHFQTLHPEWSPHRIQVAVCRRLHDGTT